MWNNFPGHKVLVLEHGHNVMFRKILCACGERAYHDATITFHVVGIMWLQKQMLGVMPLQFLYGLRARECPSNDDRNFIIDLISILVYIRVMQILCLFCYVYEWVSRVSDADDKIMCDTGEDALWYLIDINRTRQSGGIFWTMISAPYHISYVHDSPYNSNTDLLCLVLLWLYHRGWFNIEILSYQCRKSHCGDKTIL